MIYIVVLTLFSGIFLFWNLGATYLTNWDEAWYAEISRNMLLRNDYIVPFWNNAPYFDKGPLYHWLSVIFYQFFPSWELASRIPSALAGLGCILLTYKLGELLFNKKTGFLAGLILASSIGFLYRSRIGAMDTLPSFLILSSFLSYFLGVKKKKYFILLGPSLGFLFLTKSGLVFYPLTVLVFLFLIKPGKKIFENYYLVTGAIVGLAIPALWLVLGARESGKTFLDFYLNPLFWPLFKYGPVGEGLSRFSTEYLFYLFQGTKFWFIVFIPALFINLIKSFKNNRFLFLSLAFIPYFLILMATKEAGNWYLVPLYPIFALITANFLTAFQEKFTPKAKGEFFLIAAILTLSIFQNIHFSSSFIVPESVAGEVRLSREAKRLTSDKETLIIDDYYFPVASFYGERPIKVVRWQATDTALAISKESYYKYLKENDKVILLIKESNLEEIKNDLPKLIFEIKERSGDHLLLVIRGVP
ncbi:MAG: glycosyltransferase family 39 protein [bacterium]|nr:glycosyltransferase family 39 protein [bacterium]